MALGRRKVEQQDEMFVMAEHLPKAPGHVFYRKLNAVLREAGFDRWVEDLCQPYYAETQGRPGIPPGTYFRMLLIGYFEGIGSQRGIAWRCSDSLSLREFLGIPLTADSPDHSTLSVVRDRLPVEIHRDVFTWVLRLLDEKKLVKGKTVGVDSTTLEANAAMKSIVRRDTGDDYETYVKQLMAKEGMEEPTSEEVRRFDQKRQDKKVSNEEWVSESDPEARITKMKDGTTHLAYKAEHVVDLETNAILAAEIYAGDHADSQTLEDSVNHAQTNLNEAQTGAEIKDVAADKGYHATEQLTAMAEHTPYRTYIPEPELKHNRRWTDKPAEQKDAVYANRRRVKGERGKQMQRQRSEYVERTFAHVCETGGARRTWLRGLEKVHKRYLLAAAAHNIGVLMRKLFQMGTPRGLQKYVDDLWGSARVVYLVCLASWQRIVAPAKFRTQQTDRQKSFATANRITAAA
jgi:transposase